MAIRFSQAAPKPVLLASPQPKLRHAGGRPKSANPKELLTIRLDPNVIAKFKATGPGWQSRINDVLKAVKLG
jgi:uncharacterized protein (DUF4415 family)